MALNIRQLSPSEIPFICQHLAAMDPWLTLDMTTEKLVSAINRDSQRLKYIGLNADTPIGTVMFRATNAYDFHAAFGGANTLLQYFGVTSSNELPSCAHINILAVFPGNQGKAFGKELLQFAEAECARNANHVCLCVSHFNTAAQRFYINHGYTEIGRLYGIIKPGYDEIVMIKTLSKPSGR